MAHHPASPHQAHHRRPRRRRQGAPNIAKTRFELTVDPDDAYWVWWDHCHDLPDQPYIDYHVIGIDTTLNMPPNAGAIVTNYYPEALHLAHQLRSCPQFLQDLCLICHLFASRPRVIRWNIYRGEEYPYLAPNCAYDNTRPYDWTDLFWPPTTYS